MSRGQAKKIAASYAKHLKKNGFHFTHIFLYGSQAKGTAKKWSDIGICVVSASFDRPEWDKEEKKLWYLRRAIDARIEPLGMSLEEFQAVSPLSYEIKKSGIKIA